LDIVALAYPKLSLKKGREWQLRKGHPWLFSGAISQAPNKVAGGEMVDLVDYEGKFVARGYYNPASNIAVRVLTRSAQEHVDASFLQRRLRDAMELRQIAFDTQTTNVYRLINAEGDFLPGFIVDRFADVLVVQSHTAGAERLLPEFLDVLKEVADPKAIIVRNDASVRKREGLGREAAKIVHGDENADFANLPVKENGFVFMVDLVAGQKTGFFADQRDKRSAVQIYSQRMAPGAVLANVFSYSAAFSIYALAGNSTLQTINVDESAKALELAKRNFDANDISQAGHSFVEAEAFEWLEKQVQTEHTFQFVILDPPAFAKSHKDKEKALRAYARLNYLGMRCCDSGALLLTCSCSGAVSLDDLQACVRSAAAQANRPAQIIEVFKNGADHPVNAAAPESEYLKALLCRIL